MKGGKKMLPQLTFKVKLQYFFNGEKIVFSNETCSNGLLITTVSLGNERVTEKSMNGQVLSGESLIDVVISGYEYIYDEHGKVLALNQLNKNISIDESVGRINKLKNVKELSKVRIDGILAINNSGDFICSPSKNFFICKEVIMNNGENVYTYLVQQNFVCDGKNSRIENEEETYQIDDDYISIITDLEKQEKNLYFCLDGIEAETLDENSLLQEKAKSIIEQIKPLKEILVSPPKNVKSLKTSFEKMMLVKAIR